MWSIRSTTPSCAAAPNARRNRNYRKARSLSVRRGGNILQASGLHDGTLVMSDFLLTLAVRFFFGALFGALGAIFYGWRSILGSMGRSEFPGLQLAIGAIVGV